MYCNFFELSQPPFNNTPDPKFFFATSQHEEALAALRYTAEQRKGFILVTGEVGSGKTLVGRLLSHQLGSRARTAWISSSSLSPDELLSTLCNELEIDLPPNANKTQTIQALQDYLLDKYSKDRLVVVLLDEAQNLPAESFEELRMLGNLEADDAKLLQVLILGQTEIMDILRRPDMRQLRQRIVQTVHLSSLTVDETGGYIRHRLEVAGAADTVKFTPGAVELIHARSGGVPRMINLLCDQCLLTAYSESVKTVDVAIAEEVAEELAELHDEPEQPGSPKTMQQGVPNAPAVQEPAAGPSKRFASCQEPPVEPIERSGGSDGASASAGGPGRPEAARELGELQRVLSEDLQHRILRAHEVLNDLRRDADEVVRTTTRRGQQIRKTFEEEVDDRLAEAERSVQRLGKETARAIERAGTTSEEFRSSLTASLEAQFEKVRQGLDALRSDADSILSETQKQGAAWQSSFASQLEGQLDRMQQNLSRLGEQTDALIQDASERGQQQVAEVREQLEEVRGDADSMVSERQRQVVEVRQRLEDVRHDAQGLTHDIVQRGQALREALTSDLGGRIDEIQGLVTQLTQAVDQVFEEAQSRSRELRSSLTEDFQTSLQGIEQALTSLSEGAESLVASVSDRCQTIRRSLVGDVETRLDLVAEALAQLTKSADEIVADAAQQSETIQNKIADQIEGRVNHLEETLSGINGEAEKVIERASTKASEMGQLCGKMREVSTGLSQQSSRAGELLETLSKENAEANALLPVVENARDTIQLLSQAHKHADKHTGELSHQVYRAEELIRDMPEMLQQLQSATTDAKTTMTRLEGSVQEIERKMEAKAKAVEERIESRIKELTQDVVSRFTSLRVQHETTSQELAQQIASQLESLRLQQETGTKQLEVSQGQIDQMNQLIDRAGGVLSVLNAVGKAADTARMPQPASSPRPSPEEIQSQIQQAEETAEKKGGEEAVKALESRLAQMQKAAEQKGDAGEDPPPLIEFNARRASSAHRIAETNRGRILKAGSPEAEQIAQHA